MYIMSVHGMIMHPSVKTKKKVKGLLIYSQHFYTLKKVKILKVNGKRIDSIFKLFTVNGANPRKFYFILNDTPLLNIGQQLNFNSATPSYAPT